MNADTYEVNIPAESTGLERGMVTRVLAANPQQAADAVIAWYTHPDPESTWPGDTITGPIKVRRYVGLEVLPPMWCAACGKTRQSGHTDECPLRESENDESEEWVVTV